VAALPVIADLVERFEQQGDAYKSGHYNEAQLRQEFTDPMFTALGWDMDNVSGYAEAYKDVIHEDAIKIGGTRKFFLEAKKPSVDIKTDAHPAYQLRRYAWSAKLPLSILTDLEEFAVYDCRVEPKLEDKASVARVLYLEFREYASRWDDIAKIFARDAILKGSFDKFAESTKAKRGTAEVDDAFLDEIERWRADLARNLALRNPKLSQRDLNFSVQRTIDRVVFLRICEDRRIEVYGRLQALLNGEHTYRRLYQLFREADDRYNSGLFYFQKERDRVEPPDDLTPELEIDDAVLKKIIRRLYYPDSPYEFSVLPADILGQVYEQFLGKVIRLTEGHQAKVEDKPEVKKAGGVYYTPTYIVDYIVKNTVGKLLDNKTPKQAAKLRILDPACGSGSFLIAAYQYLVNWHRDWCVDDDPKKWATGRNSALYRGVGGEWKLTTGERRRILLQNIFGVDIDAQAVEVTKLSLLLKVLEGESEQTLATQLRFYHERALPDLGRNIKCGNSLIAPDFYDQQEMNFLDEEQRYRINVFDWNAEFAEIIKAGGFDAVIGNPPYGIPFSDMEIRYLLIGFQDARKCPDSYCLFIIQAFRLLRQGGVLSFVVPNTFCDLENCDVFRRWLLEESTLTYLWQSGWAFKQAIVDTVVLRLEKKKSSAKNLVSISVEGQTYDRAARSFFANELAKIDYRNAEEDRRLVWAIQQRSKPLGSFATVRAGVKMYEKGKGLPKQTGRIMKDRPFSATGTCPRG
jgi:Eco57I restriction-modification methylase